MSSSRSFRWALSPCTPHSPARARPTGASASTPAPTSAHGETRGRVRFLAKARSSAGVVRLSENSFFRREPDGRWVYVSGEVEDD